MSAGDCNTPFDPLNITGIAGVLGRPGNGGVHSMPTCHEVKVARLATRREPGSHRGCMATAEPVPQRTAYEAAVMRQAPDFSPNGLNRVC
jgi:hypothetical protein